MGKISGPWHELVRGGGAVTRVCAAERNSKPESAACYLGATRCDTLQLPNQASDQKIFILFLFIYCPVSHSYTRFVLAVHKKRLMIRRNVSKSKSTH